LARVLVPASENDRTFRIVARAMSTDATNGTRAEEEVRCYAPPTPRTVTIASATCRLVSTSDRQSPASGPETGWVWEVALRGTAGGRVGDRFGLSLEQPYVRMEKSGGALSAGWGGSPSQTVDNYYASWAVDRSSVDPPMMDWSVASLTIQDWEYTSLASSYDPDYRVSAWVDQERAQADLTCPK
jgi:hypothetical protein